MDDQNQNDAPASEDEETIEVQDEKSSQASVLLSLESLIKNNITALDKLESELRTQREMFDDSFNNDPIYKEHAEKVKEVNKVKLETKKQIGQQPSIRQLADKIKSLSSEIKERKQSLSEYLLEYQRMSGVNEIEADDGVVRLIVHKASLVRSNSKKK